MKKTLFLAALFAIVATVPALAFDLQPEPETAGYVASSDSVSNESGAVLQVGKFLGGLLKLPVSVGRDLFTGVKAGLTAATGGAGASATGSSDAVAMAPVENRTAPATSGSSESSVSKAEGLSCKVCGGSGPSKASTASKSKNRVVDASGSRSYGALAAVGSVASATGRTTSYMADLGTGN